MQFFAALDVPVVSCNVIMPTVQLAAWLNGKDVGLGWRTFPDLRLICG